MKIIPAIDLMEGQVVRLYKGDPSKKTVYSGSPIEMAKKWEKSGADMIHLVDLDATLSRGSNMPIIEELIKEISIPVEVAGGLRDSEKILETSKIASRVVLGTFAFQEKDKLLKIFQKLGREKIVISVDHLDGKIVIKGWQQDTGINLVDALREFLKIGFSEFLLTNVNRDGTLEGPDLKFLKKACAFNRANIIASGGISSIDDVKKVKDTNAYGVILGKALYENKLSIEEAKKIAWH